MKKSLISILTVLALTGCSKSEEPQAEVVTPQQETVSESAVPTEAEVNANLEKLTLSAFIEGLKPKMKDTVNEHPESASMLAYYMDLKDTKISDIKNIASTTKGKILKDSYLEQGKSICVNGAIVEIAADRSGGFPAYSGIMIDNSMQPYAFVAVGDTGELEAQSATKFCGIAVGKMSYSNSGGGSSTAPYVIGLFDLPANR